MMSSSNFTLEPEAPPKDEPVKPAPPAPVAVPESPAAPADALPSKQATTAKPPTTDEPAQLADERRPPSPIALDLPGTQQADAPVPPIAEASDTQPEEKIEPTQEPAKVQETIAQALLDEIVEATAQVDASQVTETLPPTRPVKPPAELGEETRVTEADSDDQPDPPAQPDPQTADTRDTAKDQAETPDTDKDTAEASVYDKDSVDQKLTFEKKARPKQPMVSKRRGESGTVRILIEVDATGQLVGHEVLDDAGYPRLLTAALSALKDSTFEAAKRQAKPVRSTRVIEYRF